MASLTGGISQGVLVVKNPPANAGDIKNPGFIPVLGTSPGVGNGSPLQYSCLGNPMDRGNCWVMLQSTGSQSRMWLKQLSTYTAHNNEQCWASFHVKHHSALWKSLISWHSWSLGAMCMQICWRSILSWHGCCSFDYGIWLLSSYLSSRLGAPDTCG